MLAYQGENDLGGRNPLSDPNLSDERRESTSMNQLAAPLESSIDYSFRDILHHWASSPVVYIVALIPDDEMMYFW